MHATERSINSTLQMKQNTEFQQDLMTDLFVSQGLLDISVKGGEKVKNKVYKPGCDEIFILTSEPNVKLYDAVIGKPILCVLNLHIGWDLFPLRVYIGYGPVINSPVQSTSITLISRRS